MRRGGSGAAAMKSRRDLLRAAASGVAVAALGDSARSAVRSPHLRSSWTGFNSTIVIDALGDINDPNLQPIGGRDEKLYLAGALERRTVVPRALADLRRSGVTAINLTLGGTSMPGNPFEHAVRHIAVNDEMIRRYPDQFLKVWSARDIDRAKIERKIGLIYNFQGAQMLGDDVRRVDILEKLGLRVLQLTYNDRSSIGDGSSAPENGGLTEFGRRVIDRLNANRVVVDLAHSGEQTCLDAISASRQPVAITHTGCRALANSPRNKTDAELRLLAERGGVVGIYFMPFLRLDRQATSEDLVRHIEHAVNICGEDHVGIGTDFNATRIDDVEKHRAQMAALMEERARKGIGAAGEVPGRVLFLPDLSGPDQYRRLGDLLLARGHRPSRVAKILGANFQHLFREVWGG